MKLYDFWSEQGKKSLNYAKNFKTHKYIKIVSFIGYQQNYVEAFASNNETDNTDIELMVEEIAPTAEIKSVLIFEAKEIKQK